MSLSCLIRKFASKERALNVTSSFSMQTAQESVCHRVMFEQLIKIINLPALTLLGKKKGLDERIISNVSDQLGEKKF